MLNRRIFSLDFLPILRYVLPAAFVVLILSVAAFNTNYFSVGNAPQIAGAVLPSPIQTPTSPVNSFATNQTVGETIKQTPPPEIANLNIKPAISSQEQQFIPVKYATKLRTRAHKKISSEAGGGSREFSVSSPRSSELPVGLNPSQKIEAAPNSPNPQSSIKDAQILEFIGIEIVADNGSRKVKSVKTDSLADRSGVKVGDVVEAIDGRNISDESRGGGTAEGKTLTIKRGAEKIEINLQNKSN